MLTTSTLQEASHFQISGTMVATLRGEMTHTNICAAIPSRFQFQNRGGNHVPYTMGLGQITSARIDIVDQTPVVQIPIEIILCKCFSDCNVSFVFNAADAKTFYTN